MSEIITEKEELEKFIKHNIGKYCRIHLRNGQYINYVRLHPIHQKQAEIGWIRKIERHTETEIAFMPKQYSKRADGTKLPKRNKL